MNLLRILAPLLLLAACALATGLLGYHQGTLKSTAELAQLRREQAEQAAAEANESAKRLQAEQARNDKLATDLAEQQRQHRQTTDRLIGEIARVTTLYRKALDAAPEPLPACMFTRGFVRLWNEATGAAMPATADTGGTAAQGTEARTADDQLDAGLDRAAILANHIRNAEQCRNTAAQLDALIDAVQGKR